MVAEARRSEAVRRVAPPLPLTLALALTLTLTLTLTLALTLFKGNLAATEPRTLRIHYERATPARVEHAAGGVHPPPPSYGQRPPEGVQGASAQGASARTSATPAAASSPSATAASSSDRAPPDTAPPPSRGDYAPLHAAVDTLLSTRPPSRARP